MIAAESMRRCLSCRKPLQRHHGPLAMHHRAIERAREDEFCLFCLFIGLDDELAIDSPLIIPV